MDVGISMGMKNQNGSLKLFVTECGCNMKSLDISLNGGASWFYQGYVLHNFTYAKTCQIN
jgi:lipopolysaccharide-binding protein